MTAFERMASNAEKFMALYNELRPPFTIQLVIEGDGDPSPEALHEALERASEVNPGASLRMDEARSPVMWVTGPRPTLTVVDAPEFTGEGAVGGDWQRWHLDHRTGPTCELVRVQGKHHTYLVFRALHAVMDGQGVINWTKDVMRCLRKEAPVGHPDAFDYEAYLDRLAKPLRETTWSEAVHPFGRADLSRPGNFDWRRIRVDRPLESAMIGRICVLLGRQARTAGEGRVRVHLPTDLRPYEKGVRTTQNFFNSLLIEVPPEATAESISLQVIQHLYREEGQRAYARSEDSWGSMEALRVRVYRDLTTLHDKGLYPYSATVSHLGIMKAAEMSAPDFAARAVTFVPLVGDSGGCVISLQGLDDRTDATVAMSDRFWGPDGKNLDVLARIVAEGLNG